jgi:hypothetical protein
MSTQEQPTELSKEELQKRREEISAFYKDNIKHLKVQKEYEELLRDVEKARAERLQAQMFMAQAYAAGEEGESEENTSEAKAEFEAAMSAANEPKMRTLKNQK